MSYSTGERAPDGPSARHLLILKPSSLGDIVHTLPAAAALRSHFPQARITWMVNPEWAPLLEDNPHLNDTLIFPRADFRGLSGWLRFRRWRAGLASRLQPDLILDFQGLLRTALVASAFGKAPLLGLSDAREGARLFHTRTVPADPSSHAVERCLALAGACGARTDSTPSFALPAGRTPVVPIPDRPFVVLHPFSRGPGKSLSLEVISAFCQNVGCPVILAGRTDDEAPGLPGNVVDMLNRTDLHELIWLLRHAAFVVSVDSGPMHLAAALTDKLLGIHTWSDPCKVGPYRTGAHVWKGGAIFPALDPAASNAPAVGPDEKHARAIALWISEQLGGKS